MVWYSHLLKNFPQLVVIHIIKGFSVVNEAEVNVGGDSLAFSMIQQMLAICFSPFLLELFLSFLLAALDLPVAPRLLLFQCMGSSSCSVWA